MCIDFIPFISACVMIVVDVVTGLIKAGSKGEITSSTMRSGMWHKAAELMLLVIALLAGSVKCFWQSAPFELDGVYVAVCVYCLTMELISSIENICAVNPELAASKIFNIFNIDRSDEADAPVIRMGTPSTDGNEKGLDDCEHNINSEA